MIYEIYFWKKPAERRLYMSQASLDPTVLKNLREQGYKIMLGKVDLPDDPEEPLFDEEVAVAVAPVLPVCPECEDRGEESQLPRRPSIWCGRCRKWYTPPASPLSAFVRKGDKVLVRRPGYPAYGVIAAVQDDRVIIEWDARGSGMQDTVELRDLLKTEDALLFRGGGAAVCRGCNGDARRRENCRSCLGAGQEWPLVRVQINKETL